MSWERNKDRRPNCRNYEKTVLYSIKTEDTDLTDPGMCVSVSVIEDRVDKKCVVYSREDSYYLNLMYTKT